MLHQKKHYIKIINLPEADLPELYINTSKNHQKPTRDSSSVRMDHNVGVVELHNVVTSPAGKCSRVVSFDDARAEWLSNRQQKHGRLLKIAQNSIQITGILGSNLNILEES